MIKKIGKVIVVLILVLVTVFTALLIFKNVNGTLTDIIPGYKYSGIFTRYNEIVFEPSKTVEKTKVFVDKDGKFVRKVPSNGLELEPQKTDPNEPKKVKGESLDPEFKDLKEEEKEIPDNEEGVINKDNVNLSLKIMENRLRGEGITDFTVRKDVKTGQIIFQIPEVYTRKNLETPASVVNAKDGIKFEQIQRTLITPATFTIEDPDSGKVYINEKDIDAISIQTLNDGITPGGQIAIVIRFKDNKKEELKKVTQMYKEETKEDGTIVTHNVRVTMGGTAIPITTFPFEIDNGTLILPMGESDPKNPTSNKEIMEQGQSIVRLMKSGTAPIKYTIAQQQTQIENSFNTHNAKILLVILAIVFVAMLVSFFVIGRWKGFYASLLFLSYIGIVTLFLRFTDVVITLPALVGFAAILALEYVVLIRTLLEYKEEKEANVNYLMLDTIVKAFILVIIGAVLTFSNILTLSSTAMVLVVGILLILTHNFIFTGFLIND